MNTNHKDRVAIQAKYNALWTNQMLPTEQELAEMESSKALMLCLKAAGKDFSVLMAFIAGVLLVGVIVGC